MPVMTESYTYDNDGLLTGAGSFAISRNAGNGLPETVAGGALSLTRGLLMDMEKLKHRTIL